MLDFVFQVLDIINVISDKGFEDLKWYGFLEEDVLDIIGILKFFGLINCVIKFILMWVNNEFYNMGGGIIISD